MSSGSVFDIALMGWGTRGVDQIKVEQLRALGVARNVVVDPGAPPSIFRMLEAYSADLHDLRAVYQDQAEKRDVYPAMARTVLELAERGGATVWMTYGHPLVYSTPSRILIRECRERGLRLLTFSGISSIAERMTVLEVDISERGLQIHFADHLVSLERLIDPSVDLLVMQPGGLGETRLCRVGTWAGQSGRRSSGRGLATPASGPNPMGRVPPGLGQALNTGAPRGG